jgi:GT2 family glycosyltransferase
MPLKKLILSKAYIPEVFFMSTRIQSKESISLFVVIVNYRTPDLTIECLQSLSEEVQSLPATRVIVTDNASGDGSVAQIKAAIENQGWHEWALVIPLDQNGGYAFGNNAAIRIALESTNPPPYLLLLNPDTVVRSGALKALVNFMNKHPEVGIAGSRLEDPDGTPQRSAFRFHSIWSELDSGLRLGIVSKLLTKQIVAPPISEETCQVDWVAGASMIVRRQVFEQVGLLDEGYFMYYEEVDFCLQAKKAGWSCWYVPESRVVHLVGQSSGVTNPKCPPKRRPQYWFDSRRRYFLKNYGWLYAALADTTWFFSFVLWRIRRIIQGKPDNDPPNLLIDFLCNSAFFKGRLSSPKP